jgi:hypothetical protein
MVKILRLIHFEYLVIANYVLGMLALIHGMYNSSILYLALYFYICGAIWWFFVEGPKTQRCKTCYGLGICPDCFGDGKKLA